MSIYLTFWNYRKNREDKVYFDSFEESKTTQAVLKKNGWTLKKGVWHCPKEKSNTYWKWINNSQAPLQTNGDLV